MPDMQQQRGPRGPRPLARVPQNDAQQADGPAAARWRGIERATLLTLALIAAVWFVSWAKPILIPLSFAMFVSICLTPAVSWLARRRLPRPLGAALVLAALTIVVGVGVDRTRGGAEQLLESTPAAVHYLSGEVNAALREPGSLAGRLGSLLGLGAEPAQRTAGTPSAPALGAARGAESGRISAMVERLLTQLTGQVLFGTVELVAVLFLVYLMLASGGRLRQRIARVQSLPPRLRASVRPIFDRIERRLYRYLVVLLVTNIALGFAVWITFGLFGVAHAEAWGVSAAVLHFIPYLGPALIAVGATLQAALQFHALARGLLVGASSVAISAVIGVVLQTWLFGRSARMNTVATFTCLMVWSWLWGLPGLLLGTPMTVAIKVICARIPPLRWIDVLLGEHGTRHAVSGGRSGRMLLSLRHRWRQRARHIEPPQLR